MAKDAKWRWQRGEEGGDGKEVARAGGEGRRKIGMRRGSRRGVGRGRSPSEGALVLG